jgi:hypothetical protein
MSNKVHKCKELFEGKGCPDLLSSTLANIHEYCLRAREPACKVDYCPFWLQEKKEKVSDKV